MAEAHPVGFQWVMEAKRRGATVIHVDPRFTRTSAVADLHVPIRAGTDIAFLGGLIRPRAGDRRVLRGLRAGLHQRSDDGARRLRRHRGPGRACSPATTRRPGPTKPARGSTGTPRWGRPRGPRDDQLGDDDPEVHEHERGEIAGSGRRADLHRPGARRHPAGPALRVPGAAPALRPLHAGAGARGLRHPAGAVQPGGRRADPQLRPGADQRVLLRGGLDPPHGRRPVHPRPRRSCRRCWATSAGPAAASWPCAGTPASRAPPTSPRCSTCCPATSRCRTHTASRT